MTYNFTRFNDGNGAAPRLRVQHSLWSLIKLPMNVTQEWTLAEKCRRVRDAGFEGIECWLSDENEAEHKAALKAEGLRLGLGHRPFTLDDVKRTVERALS